MNRITKNIMKCVMCIIVAFLMVLNFGIVAYNNTNEYVYKDGGNDVYVTEDIINNINTYETVYNNLKSIWIFNDAIGTVTLILYKDDVLIYEKTILNPDFYPDEYGISDDNTLASESSAIDEATEGWWGYSYYYNTTSAQSDVYWRLYDPNSDISPAKKYFFASHDSANNANAHAFADRVDDMRLAQNQLIATVAIETINMIKNLVTLAAAALAGSPTAIANLIGVLQVARDLTTAQVEKTASVYHSALMADSYYLDVYDPVIDY